jgi:hypothetical protein
MSASAWWWAFLLGYGWCLHCAGEGFGCFSMLFNILAAEQCMGWAFPSGAEGSYAAFYIWGGF